jgi:PIN domain
MEKPRVYIETTIPSAYFDERASPAMVARRDATRRWWAVSHRYEMLTSPAVLDELESGPEARREPWLRLISGLPLLEITPQILEITSEYIRCKVMPREDAFHLAIASVNRCEYLLTWNFKHLANMNKLRHIQRENERLGLFVPRILSPAALIEEDA